MKLPSVTIKQLLDAGVHLGHKTFRWNPKMSQYIFGSKDSIHIIDLVQTLEMINVALHEIHKCIVSGGKILFVSTKKQATETISALAKDTSQFYVNHRWLGGMLTNWKTISNSIKRYKKLSEDLKKESTGFTKKEILKSINLKIEGGDIIALVGHSGAGKTTIMNLIPRFYNASNGEILIDNQSIYDISLFSLRKNISLVSQDITLFDDTVLTNIAYADSKASEEKILEACKFSAVHDFVEKLPEKYDTIIGENGVRLSGGEKQRISIARAILKNAPIILLDEATSSLDADTEYKIQEAIMYLTKNKTTIIIAHRLSTVQRANKIFIVEDGRIVAEGDHSHLLKNSEIYKNFYNKQLRPH